MPPENTNSVLVTRGADAVIFDPWGRADDWMTALSSRGLSLRAIYATHAHPDHISAAGELAMCYDVPWHVAAADKFLIGWGGEILDYFGLPRIAGTTPVPHDIAPGRHVILGDINMDVYAAPGHTPGGVCYHFPDAGILLTGDTLFRDGVGRCDLPGGDAGRLRQSISDLRRVNFPDDTITIHGHGDNSTIGELKKFNPYFIKA